MDEQDHRTAAGVFRALCDALRQMHQRRERSPDGTQTQHSVRLDQTIETLEIEAIFWLSQTTLRERGLVPAAFISRSLALLSRFPDSKDPLSTISTAQMDEALAWAKPEYLALAWKRGLRTP
jgi:hypothetical protein